MRFSFAFVVYGFALARITLAWPGLKDIQMLDFH